MDLDTYRRKRDFTATPEPRGTARPEQAGNAFVIQKHAARRLHYDVRIELDGVLKSWAVPKGPSYDPDERRLAVEVEDHPLEYGAFEGVIPKGEYGGGAVLLWDRGTWEPVGDPRAGYRRGKLKFKLRGEKMRGGFTLVRMHDRDAGDRNNWLLIKERDEHARPLSAGDILEERPESVMSRRSLSEIAGDASAPTWHAKDGPTPGLAPGASADAERPPASLAHRARFDPSSLAGARACSFPEEIELALATLVVRPPPSEGWLYEMKLDGYRLLAKLRDDIELMTRRGQNWTARFPAVREALSTLPAQSAIVDGEVVVVRDDGVSDFQALQNALRDGHDGRLSYFAFDLLYLDGYDLRGCAQLTRKRALRELLAGVAGSAVRYTEHLDDEGPRVFERACALGIEGIVAKRRDAPYRGGRAGQWLKIKCSLGQEFVIGGFTEPTGRRTDLGALLVGAYEDGELVYTGKVGTGFTAEALRAMRRRLDRIARARPAFAEPPRMRGVHWVEPALVASVHFGGWTRDGRLRHASFEGLREDREPGSVVIEAPRPPPDPAPPEAQRSGRTGSQARSPDRRRQSGPKGATSVAGVRLTHPDKVLYPEAGITKAALAQYYAEMAQHMLPYVARRLLTLVRCPEGQGKPCFFQKHRAEGLSPDVRRMPINDGDGNDIYLYVETSEGLISLVQMGALEIHTWGSSVDDIELPDMLVFDLDPAPDVPWERVVEAAKTVRRLLEAIELKSYVKTTGGKGLHVVVPIQPTWRWDEVKPFTQALSDTLVRFDPTRYIATMSKARRTGKVFIDYLRNGRGATAIAPYSTRARPGAPVATPLAWEELDGPLDPMSFTIASVPRRAATTEDPWADFTRVRQSIAPMAHPSRRRPRSRP